MGEPELLCRVTDIEKLKEIIDYEYNKERN